MIGVRPAQTDRHLFTRYKEYQMNASIISDYHQRFKTPAERFWEKVNKIGRKDCWEWRAALVYKYGKFKANGKSFRAHRYSYEMEYGPIPEGMLVLHHCDNPPCVNPRHLFLGTHQDNVADRVKKGRTRSPCGEAHGKSKLSESDIIYIRNARGNGDSLGRLASQFKVNKSAICKICRRTTWKHI